MHEARPDCAWDQLPKVVTSAKSVVEQISLSQYHELFLFISC